MTFKVRSFRTTDGEETWDFGDGTPTVTVHSDGNVNQHAPDGYAVTVHRFAKPGDYLVRVERANRRGWKATGPAPRAGGLSGLREPSGQDHSPRTAKHLFKYAEREHVSMEASLSAGKVPARTSRT